MALNGDPSISSEEDQADDQLDDADQGGLFGSGSEDDASMYVLCVSTIHTVLTSLRAGSLGAKPRKLEDEELDSGDDEGRYDRATNGVGEDDQEELQDKKANIMITNIGRHPDPNPSDGEV